MNGRLIPGGPGGPGPIGPQGRFAGVPWWIHLVEFAIFMAIVAAVVLIVWAILKSPRGVHPGPMVNPAITELDLRYARGEIAREDYLTRRADIMGAAAPAVAAPATTGESPPAPTS